MNRIVPILFFFAMLVFAAVTTTADGLDGPSDTLPSYPWGNFVPPG